MKYLYVLIIVASPDWFGGKANKIPYIEASSFFKNYENCEKKIVEMHDYYLAKDIRKKNNKRRNPTFIKNNLNEKVLKYNLNQINFYAVCKEVLEK